MSRSNEMSNKSLKEQATVVRDDVVELTAIARDAVRAELAKLGDATTHALHDGRDRLAALRDETQVRVQQRPLTSLAVAASAGLLLGFFFTRRR